eukprot:8298493-Pyramimonas_sp.AAC.1
MGDGDGADGDDDADDGDRDGGHREEKEGRRTRALSLQNEDLTSQDGWEEQLCAAFRREPHVENDPPSICEAFEHIEQVAYGANARATL